ncbi:MAG: TetR/AcrR family transcriptional regulator C-terminal domain-containing protein [Lautropia sp.]|nr:TetR/AcrR family transcriptional regulator C-terminal domain-containing protein [Lautropia sp.]
MSARTPLTRDRIAQAALTLVDEVGIEAFSMRALGKQLGVDPMAIYHHLPNKDAVFDAIVERLWQGAAQKTPQPGKDWQRHLHTLFRQVRSHLLTHPRAALLMGTRPATTPALLALIEQTLRSLQATELPPHEAMPLLDCLMAFTVGKVLGEISQHQHQAKVTQALQTITPDSHPHLLQALAAGYAFEPDAQFERGLRALIEGWQRAVISPPR